MIGELTHARIVSMLLLVLKESLSSSEELLLLSLLKSLRKMGNESVHVYFLRYEDTVDRK